MKSSSSLYYWFSMFAACFIAYQQVIDNIRPNYSGNNEVINYLLGVAPNFFPAVGMPALFVILIPVISRNQWVNDHRQIMANVISLTGLLCWEFLQSASTQLQFDWHDILWTFLGAVVFQFLWTLTPDSYKKSIERKL